ncbi:MAG: nitrite/sulfite reductase [Burkholderiales bacterium]|nr:nitrite/sulfite reductase [Burkholderiales bacterium]
MHPRDEFDRELLHRRAAQFRDQLERWQGGELSDDQFRPLRLQNGWYIQRHAPMLRVAVPYGVITSAQLRALAGVAREFDLQDAGQPTERGGWGHFTTRHNLQFNWIPLVRAADVMDRLADAGLHGIQTSGNCIRNITTDARAGIAADEIADPRPYCELLRRWSTLHPEFAFLPRKFKIAVSGAREDRAAIAWHDIGLQLQRADSGAVGFRVLVGGGMGRTPMVAVSIADFVPWARILVFIEAIVRVYNLLGRRDHAFKSRIKILVKAEGERFAAAVHEEYARLLADGAPELPEGELERLKTAFAPPPGVASTAHAAPAASAASAGPAAAGAHPAAAEAALAPSLRDDLPPAYLRWLERNVHPHRLAGYRAVTLSLKRAGQAPGDVTAAQMDSAAELADRFSHGELRVSHTQNLLLPWVRQQDLPDLWQAARAAGFATPNVGLLTDMIVCPGGDLCALANARTRPSAAAIRDRFDDLDELVDLGDIDLHFSGCMNSCGHHHSGHIGILGVDKDGSEWYQVTLGGADGSSRGAAARPGRVIGPSFSADELPDVVEALVEVYRRERRDGERFVDTVDRIGPAPWRAATDAVRRHSATLPAEAA